MDAKFQKNYIGSGKQVKNFDIVRISICVDILDEFIVEHEGKKYLHFEVAKRKEAGLNGHTHAAYVSTRIA